MRLSGTGFTLPCQLVAAHDPGPMYLMGCWAGEVALRDCPPCAQFTKNTSRASTHNLKSARNPLDHLSIRVAGRIESSRLYLWRCAKSTGAVVFFAACRQKPKRLYLQEPFP